MIAIIDNDARVIDKMFTNYNKFIDINFIKVNIFLLSKLRIVKKLRKNPKFEVQFYWIKIKKIKINIKYKLNTKINGFLNLKDTIEVKIDIMCLK